ncbi:MAG: hypothetical protein WCO63_14240 [Bacteroidota bacterium]
MKKLAIILLWILIPCSLLFSQEFGVRYSYTKDKSGKDLLRELTFYDSLNKVVIRRLDIYDFNPFLKMGFKSEFDPNEQFPRILLQGKKVEDMIPQSFASRYTKGSISPKDSLKYGIVSLYVCQKNPYFSLLVYNMKMMSSKKTEGMVANFNYFDKRGVDLLNFNQYDVNVNDAVISPKGRYVVHSFGYATPDGQTMKSGLRIFDRLNNQYAEVFVDSASIRKLTDTYLCVYSYATSSENPGFKVQYFDFKRVFIYTQVYSDEFKTKFHANLGDKAVFKMNERVISLENDFAGEELQWKSYEKDWKQVPK